MLFSHLVLLWLNEKELVNVLEVKMLIGLNKRKINIVDKEKKLKQILNILEEKDQLAFKYLSFTYVDIYNYYFDILFYH